MLINLTYKDKRGIQTLWPIQILPKKELMSMKYGGDFMLTPTN